MPETVVQHQIFRFASTQGLTAIQSNSALVVRDDVQPQSATAGPANLRCCTANFTVQYWMLQGQSFERESTHLPLTARISAKHHRARYTRSL